jgi:hypothetical protein
MSGHLDKRQDARQFVRMAFGPFVVKTSFGQTTVEDSRSATAFLRALGAPYRTTYHWKVAERMLEHAWTNAEAENMAAKAFQIALEADDLLIGKER